MVQKTLTESKTPETDLTETNDALVICSNCKKLVPKTNICLYCGSPILYKSLKEKKDHNDLLKK